MQLSFFGIKVRAEAGSGVGVVSSFIGGFGGSSIAIETDGRRRSFTAALLAPRFPFALPFTPGRSTGGSWSPKLELDNPNSLATVVLGDGGTTVTFGGARLLALLSRLTRLWLLLFNPLGELDVAGSENVLRRDTEEAESMERSRAWLDGEPEGPLTSFEKKLGAIDWQY
jgi:hypothetical protein